MAMNGTMPNSSAHSNSSGIGDHLHLERHRCLFVVVKVTPNSEQPDDGNAEHADKRRPNRQNSGVDAELQGP